MSLQVEKQEKNMAVLTIEVPAEEFEAAIEKAYQKNKGRIQIPGFRKGKVPRRMIEQMYGKGFFYEDAANSLIPDAYEKALEECEETIVSSPKIDVKQIEAGKPFIFTAEVALKPEVTLGAYKGVEVPKADVTVTDEEVDAALTEMGKEFAMSADELKNLLDMDQFKEEQKLKKATDFVMEHAKVTAPKKAKKGTKKAADDSETTEKKPAKKTTRKAAKKAEEEENQGE